MPETITIDFDQPIPLFPLTNCAVLPYATVPLHVFEPRYRAMVEDALASNRLIAAAVFEGDAWRDDYFGTPPLREHVCIGVILQHQALSDGCYNILIQGICRARIVREIEHEPYRMAMLMPTETRSTMEIDLSDARQRIEALLDEPLMKQLASVHAVQNWLSEDIPTTAMVDLTILTMCPDTSCRYAMLAEPDANARADWLTHHLRHTRQVLKMADRLGPATTDDGIHLN